MATCSNVAKGRISLSKKMTPAQVRKELADLEDWYEATVNGIEISHREQAKAEKAAVRAKYHEQKERLERLLDGLNRQDC
jgi:hypothetical protein